MQFEFSTLDKGVLRVTLSGRLDIDGALKLELPLAAQVATKKAAVVIDLTALEFIASIGMRLLVKNAKAQLGRGGKLVLCNPNPLVRDSLKSAGLTTIIPVFDDLASASQAALAGLTP